MERSEPGDGAWDEPLDPDDAFGGLAGEPEYPLAPIPTHERQWRHPSELGHAQWVQSERSVGLGRGLMITSGAIGCILGLAVVWLMVPGPAGTPSAGPTVTRSDLALPTTAGFAPPAPTSAAVPATVAGTVAPTLPLLIETTEPAQPPTTSASVPVVAETVPSSSVGVALLLPAEDLPTNTVWLKSEDAGAEAAVAVLVGDSPYMITTATAVGSTETVRVMLASGGVTYAPVVSIEGEFAYLEPDESMHTFGFETTAVAAEGESLTVLNDEQVVYVYGDETLDHLDPASVAEGTPVVNEEGALVGLCTTAAGHVEMIPIESDVVDGEPEENGETPTGSEPPQPAPTTAVPSSTSPAAPSTTASPASSPSTTAGTAVPVTSGSPTTSVSSTTTTSTPSTSTSSTTTDVTTTTTTTEAPAAKQAWMGIGLGGDGGPPMRITRVTPDSPAHAAGLVVGDEVLALDGTVVSTAGELATMLQSHAPGDTVVVTVKGPPDGGGVRIQRDVTVVLGEHSL